MTTSVAWFRRVLRVHDNPVLHDARSAADRVACLFVVEQRWLAASPKRAAVLAASIRALAEDLARRGGSLTIRNGPAATAVGVFAREVGAASVHADEDVTPRARSRDAGVAAALDAAGIAWQPTAGVYVREPGVVRSASGTPYKIFTPFHRRWREQPARALAPTPRRIDGVAAASDPIAVRALDASPPVEQRDPRRAFRRFVHGGDRDDARHRLDGSGGSGLSPAFRFGALSPLFAAREAEHLEGWTRQLAWRDFAADTVLHHPQLLTRSLRGDDRSWSRDTRALEDWRSGSTGEPVIDAAMRQLGREGWISNRARMTVASFLVRDLRIDWREGARHFMGELIDGDPAVNAFNWQWVAGTGFDAPAPFWRLNPQRQGERYDPDGAWRERWSA